MTRMLEALKQLDARSPHVPATDRPVPPGNHAGAVGRLPAVSPSAEEPVDVEPIHLESAPAQAPEAVPLSPSPPEKTCFSREAGNGCLGELAQNILNRLPANGRALLAFAGWEEQDAAPEGLVRALAALLAVRTEGGVLFVERDCSLATRSPDAPMGNMWADVFSGKAAWQTLVRRTEVAGFDVLVEPARPFPPRNESGEWDPIGFVKALRQAYAIVLFDAIPLGDLRGSPWIGCCDGTYLLVHLHQTPRRAALRGARVIRKRCGRFMGCIVVE